jgi:integrase
MAEAHLPLTSLQSLLGHKDVRTTQIYVRLSDSHLQSEYNRAIGHIIMPCPTGNSANDPKRKRSPKVKVINWSGYLDNLPEWLAQLIHAYCSQDSQANDSLQRTRNSISQLSRFFRWVLENHSLSCLSDIIPRCWFAYTDLRLHSGIKPTSLNTILRILQSFLKFVGDLGHPICKRMLEIRPLKTGELLPRGITETQLNRLLNEANLFDYTWILLMAHSGLRTCEIRNLRWQDVDLQRRTIQINESKGLRSRTVFLSTPTLDALKQVPKTSKFVFTYNNQPLSSRYCQSRLKTLGEKSGIHVTAHQLRYTCGTLLLNAGMSIFAVQAILGHKYVDTTLRYARVYDAVVAKDYKQAMNSIKQTSRARPPG